MLLPLDYTTHALVRDDCQLRPLPDLRRDMAPSRDVLAAGGRMMVFDRGTLLDDESLELMHRRASLGLYRLRFSDLSMERATYEPRPGWQNGHTFGASRDGQRLLVSQSWVDTPHGRNTKRGDGRATVSLVGFSGTPARELFTIVGSTEHGADDLAIQWSPDSTQIAIAVLIPTGPRTMPPDTILILDASTGREVSRVTGACLAGSASWHPDGSQLLVRDLDERLWIHDLGTDTRRAIPALPGRRPDPSTRGPARLLGYANDHELLVATQRGRTMTVSAIDPDTGEGRGLVRWTGIDDTYPVLTPMPAGYWS